MQGRHSIGGAIAFLISIAPLPGAEENEKQVLLWIRAGALSPPEVEGSPDEAPRLREMVLDGVTAAELTLADPVPLDPKSLAAILFDAPARERIREGRGAPVAEVGPLQDEAARAATGAAWAHPVVGFLEKRFGRPPPPGDDEDASIQRIRAILGGGGAAAEPADPPRAAAAPLPAPSARADGEDAKPEAGSLDVARRAIAALQDGAPLVIALEPVQDPARSKERDAALGWLAAGLRGQDTFLLVLSVRGGARPVGKTESSAQRATFTVAGPGVRRGLVIGERKPIAALTATTFRLLGVTPPARQSSEAIDALKR